MAVSVKVSGLSDLKKAMQTLPEKLERGHMRAAMRAGAVVIRDSAKSKVPVETGLLKAGIKVKSRSSRKGIIKARVMTTGPHQRIANLVEFGTKPHVIKPKAGKFLFFGGKMRALVHHPGARKKPYMRPTFDEKGHESVKVVARALKERLMKKANLDVGFVKLDDD